MSRLHLPVTDEVIGALDVWLGEPVLARSVATIEGVDRAHAALFVVTGMLNDWFGPDADPSWVHARARLGDAVWAGAHEQLLSLRDRVAAELASVTSESTSSHTN